LNRAVVDVADKYYDITPQCEEGCSVHPY